MRSLPEISFFQFESMLMFRIASQSMHNKIKLKYHLVGYRLSDRILLDNFKFDEYGRLKS